MIEFSEAVIRFKGLSVPEEASVTMHELTIHIKFKKHIPIESSTKTAVFGACGSKYYTDLVGCL